MGKNEEYAAKLKRKREEAQQRLVEKRNRRIQDQSKVPVQEKVIEEESAVEEEIVEEENNDPIEEGLNKNQEKREKKKLRKHVETYESDSSDDESDRSYEGGYGFNVIKIATSMVAIGIVIAVGGVVFSQVKEAMGETTGTSNVTGTIVEPFSTIVNIMPSAFALFAIVAIIVLVLTVLNTFRRNLF